MRTRLSVATARRLLAVSLALWATLACEDPDPGLVGVVRRVDITIPASTLRPGRVMTAFARPLDADGALVTIPVTWRSLTPTLLEVDSTGALRALAPGTAIIEAVAGGVTGRREIPLVNPPIRCASRCPVRHLPWRRSPVTRMVSR
jgi:hypothetical protein